MKYLEIIFLSNSMWTDCESDGMAELDELVKVVFR